MLKTIYRNYKIPLLDLVHQFCGPHVNRCWPVSPSCAAHPRKIESRSLTAPRGWRHPLPINAHSPVMSYHPLTAAHRHNRNNGLRHPGASSHQRLIELIDLQILFVNSSLHNARYLEKLSTITAFVCYIVHIADVYIDGLLHKSGQSCSVTQKRTLTYGTDTSCGQSSRCWDLDSGIGIGIGIEMTWGLG